MQPLKKQLVILGAGGHAKVVLDIAQHLKQYEDIMIFDDWYQPTLTKMVLNLTVIGNGHMMLAQLKKSPDAVFMIAIGNTAVRGQKFTSLLEQNVFAADALFHPSSVIAQSVIIGKGSVVMANVVINPDAIIGDNVIVNTAVVIEHDCRVGNHVHLSPNATLCGGSSVGDFSWIGAGAVVIEGKKVGKNCMIGAGAVVTDDIPDNTLALGVPAKPIKK